MGRWDVASNLPIAAPIICVGFDFKVVRRFSRRDFGGDFDRLSGGEEPVHTGSGDADALLSPAHSEAVKFSIRRGVCRR